VMNTDNMTISGETIDYGPCAFMEVFDPATVFSSIDHGGRYAYGNQPQIAQWNLARLAETLLPLIDADAQAAIAPATQVLEDFAARYREHWERGLRAKLGLTGPRDPEDPLEDDLLAMLRAQRVDFTAFFRGLSAEARGSAGPARDLFVDLAAFDAWAARWRAQLAAEGVDPAAAADAMERVNPVYIPRNHQVEAALAAATDGELDPFRRLLDAVSRPFEVRPGLEAYAEPAPDTFGAYQTFCGT